MCNKVKHSSSHRRAEISAQGKSYPQDKPLSNLKPRTDQQ